MNTRTLNIELKNLSENLQTKDFEALAPGLGLGPLQWKNKISVMEEKKEIVENLEQKIQIQESSSGKGIDPSPPHRDMKVASFEQIAKGGTLNRSSENPSKMQKIQKSQTKPPSRSYWRWISSFFLSHCLDLIIMMLTIVAVFSVVEFSLGDQIEPSKFIRSLPKIWWEWTNFVTPIDFLVGLYASFIVYWLLFKFVCGQTLGKILMGR